MSGTENEARSEGDKRGTLFVVNINVRKPNGSKVNARDVKTMRIIREGVYREEKRNSKTRRDEKIE